MNAKTLEEKEAINVALLDFHRSWKLDYDLIRCSKCNRGIHWTRNSEGLCHAFGCAIEQRFPWEDLANILDATGLVHSPAECGSHAPDSATINTIKS